MSKIRHTLQLLHSGNLSIRQIGAALGISKSTVSEIASYTRAAGLDWAQTQNLSDEELQARLYRPPVTRQARHLEPDYAQIHSELKRAGVTLQLLWEEYQQQHQGEAYKYSAFCEKYRQWAKRLKRSMRQTHEAGDKLFVDYAGQTVPVVDANTGEITQAQVFVAVLGASNYTYACATPTQKAADWIASIIAALEFIGGRPRLLVPDQPRALMAKPDRYEPTNHRLLQELSEHYKLPVLPARPAKPRDKPKVEVAVQVVERWILARLRHQRFFSLGALNKAIAALLQDLNQRPFKKLPGCRANAFASLDQPALKPLPATRMQIARFKSARVNIDCPLVGKEVGRVRMGSTKDRDHAGQGGIGACSHVHGGCCQPDGIDADHLRIARVHCAKSPAALMGHVRIIETAPLRSSTLMSQSAGSCMAVGSFKAMKAGAGAGAVKATAPDELAATSWWHPLRSCSLSQRCSTLAFMPWPLAMAAMEAPGC